MADRDEARLDGAGLDGAGRRTIVVPTLGDDRPLWYRNWVVSNREKVREATDGRAGYIHIPDMGPWGWSEFHRSYVAEVERDALVIDVRFNGGGHVSALILEKLARRRIGWDVPRRGAPVSYPEEAPAGPMVAITNEYAGSDGDIFTHGFKLLHLGPVVGMRTWGGVIGIEINQPLVDGSVTTQPEYAFWFEDVGLGVENRGTDPDEEVLYYPQDYAAGRDPQLGARHRAGARGAREVPPGYAGGGPPAAKGLTGPPRPSIASHLKSRLGALAGPLAGQWFRWEMTPTETKPSSTSWTAMAAIRKPIARAP